MVAFNSWRDHAKHRRLVFLILICWMHAKNQFYCRFTSFSCKFTTNILLTTVLVHFDTLKLSQLLYWYVFRVFKEQPTL